MEATIRTFASNAELIVNGEYHHISWDGLEFDTEEYSEWITEVTEPASKTSNYDEVRLKLETATDYLRP